MTPRYFSNILWIKNCKMQKWRNHPTFFIVFQNKPAQLFVCALEIQIGATDFNCRVVRGRDIRATWYQIWGRNLEIQTLKKWFSNKPLICPRCLFCFQAFNIWPLAWLPKWPWQFSVVGTVPYTRMSAAVPTRLRLQEHPFMRPAVTVTVPAHLLLGKLAGDWEPPFEENSYWWQLAQERI